MPVWVQAEPLDPWREVAAYQLEQADHTGKFGATAVFVGTMRDFNQGQRVEAMHLEHYPGMTEKCLETVCWEARSRWEILDTLVVHRSGSMLPNDPIVLVAVWAGHRDHAFAACRYIIDELKVRAPFWKKETTAAGARWLAREED